MNAGKLKWPITIQRKSATGRDSAGHAVETWTNVFTPFAARIPVRGGKEYYAAAAVSAESVVRYEIRYRPGITNSMRLVDRGRIYQIVAVLDDVYGDRTETHLMTKEHTDG